MRTLTEPVLPAALADGRYDVQAAGSVVRFRVAHFRVQRVHGTIGGVRGTVEVTDGRLHARGSVQVATIATANPARDAHLRSYLFATDEHPAMELEVDAPVAKMLPATLRIRGRAVPVRLQVDGTADALRVRFTVDRREAGLTWPAAVEAGGIAVGREVSVELTLVLRAA